ncbi:hypothetical protein [Tengunoibacter tsumagoiensis]|uniref:Uncharacterized protein n=1 Tax=Tengunoibacter tsumagoiensis TaxID=2014871 RepID=A0A402A6I2_9CHLR|nr:hypothetical protein [Tengunoibacter tsumagoiensis]GCE14601.1 hypothetical protein KTT_44600 [Tengunoibacter tsumagoiensis]
MDKRVWLGIGLVVIVISGLIAGLFSNDIQRNLTISMSSMMHTGSPAKTPQVPGTRPGMKTPQATQAAQGQQQGQGQVNLLAQDTFQRTSQALWGTASDGRSWSGDANKSAAFSITNASGQIKQTQAGQGTFNALLGPANENTEIVMSGMVSAFGNATNLGAVVRWNDDNNWYKAFIDGNALTVVKHVNGNAVQLKSVPFQAQNNMLYQIRFRAYGAMLFAKAWRADGIEPTNWMIVAGDNSFTNGQAGVRVVLQANTVVNITSFAATIAAMDKNSAL